MIDFSKYEKGFYKVLEGFGEPRWTVLFFDGQKWYDHVFGKWRADYDGELIKQVGEKIELPSAEEPERVWLETQDGGRVAIVQTSSNTFTVVEVEENPEPCEVVEG